MLNATAAVLGIAVPTAETGEGEGFHAPTIEEFFPPQLFGEGTWWGPTRINLLGLAATFALVVFFVLAFRGSKLDSQGAAERR